MEDRMKDTTGSVRERSRGDRGKRKHSDLHVGSTSTRRSSDSEGGGDVLCGWRKDNTRRVKDSSSVSSWLSESDQSSSELETRKKKHKKRKYQNRKNDKRDSSSESDQSSSELETRKKKHKKRKNRNKRSYKQDSSSDSSWSSESDQSSREFHIKKKHKKREKKRKRISKHSKKTTKKHSKKKSKSKETRKQKDGKISEKKGFNAEQSGRQLKDCLQSGPQQSEVITDTSEPLAKKKRSMAPMTREEHEKQQSVVRRVYDPETGRHRLVKGDGEIIEEIVSQQRHREINKTATRGDGAFFQAALGFCDK